MISESERQAAKLDDIDGAYEFWPNHYYDRLEAHLTSLGLEDIISDVDANLFHCVVNNYTGVRSIFGGLFLMPKQKVGGLVDGLMRLSPQGVWPYSCRISCN